MHNPLNNSPTRWSVYSRRVVLTALWVGIVGTAYWWGRTTSMPRAQAEPPAFPKTDSTPIPPTTMHPTSDYSKRVVAYIHDTTPITREELGEYLIARYGAQKLPLLINKKIIDRYCAEKGVTVTAAEIEAAVAVDVAGFGVNRREFETHVLKRYNKSLFEWKEDVVRPRLLMTKLCGPRITVTPEDLAKAFETKYGEKVDCKIIVWPKSEEKVVLHQIWPKIRTDEAAFDSAAAQQVDASLASVGGHVKPVGKGQLNDERLDKVLWRLRSGEVSEVIDTAMGLVVIKCLGRTPPDTQVTMDKVRGELEKEIYDKKINAEIPKLFQELQAAAKSRNLFSAPTAEDLKQGTEEMLQQTQGMTGPGDKGVIPAAISPPK